MPHAAARTPSWRDRVKSHRGTRFAYQTGVFFLGLLLIVACLGLWTVLPAPLAIPPMLVGVWIWSTEFPFARDLLERLKRKAQDGRRYAKEHPVPFGILAATGLLIGLAGYWAFFQFA